MDIKDYTVYFKKQKKILFKYLFKLLRENSVYKGDPRPFVRDMVELIYLEAFQKVLKGDLSKLPIPVVIMIKARDVFYQSIRKPKKKLHLDDMPPEAYDIPSSDPDPHQRLELREDMQIVDKLLDDASRQIFENIADQVPGRAIANELDITHTALTTRIYRLRKRMQKHLIKGY